MTTQTQSVQGGSPAKAAGEFPVSQEQIDTYRRDGFVQINDVITGDELVELRNAVSQAVIAESGGEIDPSRPKSSYEEIFIQKVNLWQRHPAVRKFVLSARLANIAAKLSGHVLRVWHDQALFKEPKTGAKTPWHQDAHYWPHTKKDRQITIWIALEDATVQNGCMSFIPETQKLENIEPVNLGNPQNVFEIAPELKGIKPVTCELKAGSVTFHHGLTFHFAGPNKSDTMRKAFAIIYMADGTLFNGDRHLVTEPIKSELKAGENLEGETFPIVGRP